MPDNGEVRGHLWWLVGLALLGGGVALAIATRVGDAEFGWVAYTPTDSAADWTMAWGDGASTDTGWLLVVSGWQVLGAGVAALGLVVSSAGVGYRLGRRRSTR